MDTFFLVLLVFLAILAAVDLFVGVSNDAVNFLNSAVGSRIAPFKVVLGVAAVGVLLGATVSGGLMEIARRCRLTEALARLLHPLTRWLFPTVPQGSPAMQAICMNLSANLLGLGNAATPLGLAAMRELQKLNPHKDSASNAMVTFVAMNTASLQLIPTTCAVLRQQAGSAAPMEILPAVWLTGLSSLAVVLLLDRLLRGKSHQPE